MRKIYFLLLCMLAASSIIAQEKLSKEEKARREKNIEAGNPFKQFGYKGKVATLSKGKYLEVHDLDSIVVIGSVRFHVERKEIVGFVVPDTLNGMYARPIGDMPSRWLSPDPLAEEFTSWSPYSMCFDNPLRYIDPDGKAPLDWFKNQQGRVVWFNNTSKGFTDTNGGKWSNIGATTNEVKQSLRVPAENQITKWGTVTAGLADGTDGAGKTGVSLNIIHFQNNANVSYDLDIANIGVSGELIGGKSEITGVTLNAQVSSETSAPGIQIDGVSGFFGVKSWTPAGKNFIVKSEPFQDYKGPMLSNSPFHATSNASLTLPLSSYLRMTNTNPPSTGLNLSFKTWTATTNRASIDGSELFNTSN